MYGANLCSVHCCGHNEVGDFKDPDEEGDPWESWDVEAETPEAFMQAIKNYAREGLVLSIWFVKCQDWQGPRDDWSYTHVRDLVQQIPNVVSLGLHVNPNTSNTIDGYLWVNHK